MIPTIEPIDEQHRAKIKVIGIGGCGGNVIDYLCEHKVKDVRYTAINTDAQALAKVNEAVERVQIGQALTKGLGTGANPEYAKEAAKAESDRIREMVQGHDMVFIAAGMGKGTGTGASPVVAEIARSEGVLTVAVVTRPFEFEKRDKPADAGLAELEKYVDSLVIVPNDKLMAVLGDVSVDEAFRAGIAVLYNAVCGISEIITKPGLMNVDFNDVRSVMQAKGKAVIGSSAASGENRATVAANEALCSPLMEDVNLSQAQNILVNITGNSKNIKLSEMYQVQEIIKEQVPNSGNAQFTGLVYDDTMEDELRVTIIVTGLHEQRSETQFMLAPPVQQVDIKDGTFQTARTRAKLSGDNKSVPAVLRKQVN